MFLHINRYACLLFRYCSVEIPPRERSSEQKVEIRSEPLSLEAQSIWHREAETISERWDVRFFSV